jgi:hypothetical protein
MCNHDAFRTCKGRRSLKVVAIEIEQAKQALTLIPIIEIRLTIL